MRQNEWGTQLITIHTHSNKGNERTKRADKAVVMVKLVVDCKLVYTPPGVWQLAGILAPCINIARVEMQTL